jgi:peptidoglycan/xylan/chitin deacetylase (PgdA/CDA1 family)
MIPQDSKDKRPGRATLCLTLDNMGRAKEVGEGKSGVPDPRDPSLVTGYPKVLDLLDRLGLKATFFIESWNCLHHPEKVRELAARGHDVGVHGWVHEKFAELGREKAQQVLYDCTAMMRALDLDPTGFRAPGGVRGAHAAEILANLGYEYDSSIEHTHAQEIAGAAVVAGEPRLLPSGLVNIPWLWSAIDVIHYFRRSDGPGTPQQLVAEWRARLDAAKRTGGTLTVIVHPYVSGTDDLRFKAIESFLGSAAADEDVEILTAREVARRVRAAQGQARP